MPRRSGHSPAVLAVAILAGAFSLPLAGAAAADPPVSLLATNCSPTDDVTTGGGWLLPDTQQKRTFTLVAGVGPNAPVLGRLLVINHITNQRVEGDILVYGPNPSNTRTMSGTGTVNGAPMTFVLQVTDVAEPGREQDLFTLIYESPAGSNTETGPLGGGNIQIRPLCATAAPFAAQETASLGVGTSPVLTAPLRS
jgi:hypothetical protein